MQIDVSTIKQLEEAAQTVAAVLCAGDVLSLEGDLGAGKTTFVQALAKTMDIKDTVTSPTFSIANFYEGSTPLWHLDLYRLDTPEELEDIGYEDYFYPEDAITCIEWAEKAGHYLPKGLLTLRIKKSDETRTLYLDDTLTQRLETQ